MADQGAEGLLSPFLRQRRTQAARPHLKGRVLDVGCGAGLLARYVAPADYLGIDIDAASLAQARAAFPNHRFELSATPPDGDFDTIVALAVIEHVATPDAFLQTLRDCLKPSPASTIVCTTPHPRMEWVHRVGARLGVFSQSANEEHQDLLNQATLQASGAAAGLTVQHYRRFLWGANQLIIYSLKGSA